MAIRKIICFYLFPYKTTVHRWQNQVILHYTWIICNAPHDLRSGWGICILKKTAFKHFQCGFQSLCICVHMYVCFHKLHEGFSNKFLKRYIWGFTVFEALPWKLSVCTAPPRPSPPPPPPQKKKKKKKKYCYKNDTIQLFSGDTLFSSSKCCTLPSFQQRLCIVRIFFWTVK